LLAQLLACPTPPPVPPTEAAIAASEPLECADLAPTDLAEQQRDEARAMQRRAPEPWIDWPIPYNDERARLTAAYLARHRGPQYDTGDAWRDVQMEPKLIVLHWTASATARAGWNAFEPIRSRRRGLLEGQLLNVSSHFLVDRDGTIYRLVPEDLVARHTIGLNHLAIGVENVGDGRRWSLTQAQVDANARLVRWLATTYPITHLIGHHEYRLMEGHPYFEELIPSFRTGKVDPGPAFMSAVRAQVADLGLSGPSSPADSPESLVETDAPARAR